MSNFLDGITSLFNGLANRRNAMAGNVVSAQRVSYEQLRAIAKTGLGSKIIRLKAGYALNDTIQFASTDDRVFYQRALQKEVKRAAGNMVAYGRGIIVLYERGKALSEPLTGIPDLATVRIRGFAGDMVTAPTASVDLNDPRYLKPRFYHVRGVQIHHTRVVDFRYVEPPELDLPVYQYGGISEFELIYNQIINDGVVERAAPAILEKNATLFYKVKDFKDLMMAGREDDLLKYFARLEDGRSVYGAGLIDSEDDAFVLDQTLTNLADVDMITLRRLAMVTGIPLALLVGENVKGLNSTGDNERAAFQDMIETLQSDHLLEPITELMHKLGQGDVEFKDNQGQNAGDRIAFETAAIANAEKLYIMGEDHRQYLEKHAVVEKDDFSMMFPEPEDDLPQLPAVTETPATAAVPDDNVDPRASLNGAQVTAILEIIGRIRTGELSKATAIKVIATAFPVSESEASTIIQDVQESPAGAEEDESRGFGDDDYNRDEDGKFSKSGGGNSGGSRTTDEAQPDI